MANRMCKVRLIFFDGVLEYSSFFGSIEYNANDNCFFGKIKEISDLVSYEGDSIRTLQKAFKEAVDDYIETKKTMHV